jgi:hypothetical protein
MVTVLASGFVGRSSLTARQEHVQRAFFGRVDFARWLGPADPGFLGDV